MTNTDPNLHWDGHQWLRWNGAHWVGQPQAVQPYQAPATPYQPAYPPTSPAFASDKTGQSIQMIVAWILTVLTLGYFLPWAIAASRGKANAGAIGILNLLLGWTIIGWVVALIMACSAHQGAATQNVTVVTAVGIQGGYPAAAYPPPPPPAYVPPPPAPTGYPLLPPSQSDYLPPAP
jgi:hypothetical protein